MGPTTINRKYRPRIMRTLKGIAKLLQAEGYETEGPLDLSADTFWYSILVKRDGQEAVDVSIKICESEEYDGEKGGINFALDIVEWGGRILGGLCPFNYSPQCWVNRRNPDEIEERFRLLEGADYSDLGELIA